MLRDYVRRLPARLAAAPSARSASCSCFRQTSVWSRGACSSRALTLVLPISYGLATVIAGAAAIGLAVLLGESFRRRHDRQHHRLRRVHRRDARTRLGAAAAFAPPAASRCCSPDWAARARHMDGICSALGAGPRDALMVALARKTGRSAGVCRICADILVTVSGFLLGGQFGIGTVISALGLGSLINLNFSLLHFHPAKVHQENIAETLRYLRS